MTDKMTFEQRCALAQNCLPQAEYRNWLTALHNEMLADLKRLLAAEAEWAARSQDDGKAQGEIDRLRAALHEAHAPQYPGGGSPAPILQNPRIRGN